MALVFLDGLPLIAHFESFSGFHYTFDSLHSPDEGQDTLYGAIRNLLSAKVNKVIFAFQVFFPIFRYIVSIFFHGRKYKQIDITLMQPTNRSRVLDRELEKIRNIGSELIENKKSAILAECNVDGSGAIGKQDVQGHDLLSLLIKSNIASDIPENMRMSDSEILARQSHFCFLFSVISFKVCG